MKKLSILLLGVLLIAGCSKSNGEVKNGEVKKVCNVDGMVGIDGMKTQLTATGSKDEVKKMSFDFEMDLNVLLKSQGITIDLETLGDEEKKKITDTMTSSVESQIKGKFGSNKDAVKTVSKLDGSKLKLNIDIDGSKVEGGMEKVSMDDFAKMVEKDMGGKCK